MMEALVLAGGLGTRLRQAVPDLPKVMAPVAGRPFLEHLLRMLARGGFARVILSLGYKAEVILDHFGSAFAGMELVSVVELMPLGTGGAVRLGMERMMGSHLAVVNGDTYLEVDARAMERRWQADHVPLILGHEVPDSSRYGRLEVENGRVVGFLEKGRTGPGLINAGAYLLQRGQLEEFAPGAPFSLEKDYLEAAVHVRRFDLFLCRGRFIDMGVPEDYARAQRLFAAWEKEEEEF